MTSNSELREMSDEQLDATAAEAARELFRLRFQFSIRQAAENT